MVAATLHGNASEPVTTEGCLLQGEKAQAPHEESALDRPFCHIDWQGDDRQSFAVIASAANSTKHQLNGWYTCSDFTFSDTPLRKSGQHSECAVYSAPLCYPGICEAPETAEATVDIFVKRIPATLGDVTTASNVWLLAGGPGFSSVELEWTMLELHKLLRGTVNVYTMDHRGTGRSTILDCVAAQAMTTGSPRGRDIRASEVPNCAEDLQFKYGDLASFSTTSAASDISSFISNYSNGASTFVYGVSYGTVLVERLMHLNPPNVKGYLLDSVATTSGASVDKFAYVSTWDTDYGEVGEYFLRLCTQDSECRTRFQSTSLSSAVRELIVKVDNDPSSACATLIADGVTSVPPSYMLRYYLAGLLKDINSRTLIPPVVYRMNRCNANDVDVLTQFMRYLGDDTASTAQADVYYSTLLHSLVVFSELWEIPAPTDAEMKARFTRATITDGIFDNRPLYCAFSKDKSAGCTDQNSSNYKANGIIYQRDQYWNKRATIPSETSVLLLQGKLDPQTPPKFAESLIEVLDTSKKELIMFDYATHGITSSTPIWNSDDTLLTTCGLKLFASYVSNNGSLDHLDRSCVNQMPAFNLTVPEWYLHNAFGTDEAYDGIYNSSLISS